MIVVIATTAVSTTAIITTHGGITLIVYYNGARCAIRLELKQLVPVI